MQFYPDNWLPQQHNSNYHNWLMVLKTWRRHDSKIWGCWNLGHMRLHWVCVLSDNFQNINVCWNEVEDVEDLGFVWCWPASVILMDADDVEELVNDVEFVQSRSCFKVKAAVSCTLWAATGSLIAALKNKASKQVQYGFLLIFNKNWKPG